jgi:excinuclease UvrABC helicase subunit UvrB
MNFEELKKMTIVKLREKAQEFPDVKGTSGMKKNELIDLLCEKLNIEKVVKAVKVPANKQELKKRIQELKTKKEEALSQKDYKAAAILRRRIHVYKHHLRKMAPDLVKITKK